MTDLEELGLEKEIGSYGLKSKVFLGFTPLQWIQASISKRDCVDFYLKRGLYLKLEINCSSDIKSWKGNT